MGFWRVLWTGCCGMCCLIPMAWIGFVFLDLGAAVTNGLFENVGLAIGNALEFALAGAGLGAAGAIIPFIANGILGIIMLIFFPLHWALYYRPDNIGFAFAIMGPWILVGTLTSLLFCKKAKQGFDTGLSIGIGYMIIVGVIPYILQAVIAQIGGGMSIDIVGLFDGLFTGMTDLPYLGAVIASCLEGGLIAGIFGAFIGSLKFDPEKLDKKGKKSKKSEAEPVFGSSESTFGESSSKGRDTPKSSGDSVFCPNCGASVGAGDPFCPNCGTKT